MNFDKTNFTKICQTIANQPLNPEEWTDTILNHLDLTSLNSDDSEQTIEQLCQTSQSRRQPTAAVCVYPQFVKQSKSYLQKTSTRVATVINFPSGDQSQQIVIEQCQQAIQDGADEIDCVFPYHQFLQTPTSSKITNFLKAVRECCHNVVLKIILETSAFPDNETLFQACQICLRQDIDFLKTSTGKTDQGATLQATAVMGTAIDQSPNSAGIKVSGGIKSLLQAVNFYRLTTYYLRQDRLTTEQFRIGASSLSCALY